MKILQRMGVSLGVIALLAACGQQQETGEYAEEVGDGTTAVIEEIPVTTASDVALGHFEQGLALFDVGRAVPAAEHFRLAIETDPTLVRAYVGLASSVFSAEEARAAIDQAMANLEGASDGERILVEIVQAGQDNDTDRQLALAQSLVEQYPNSPRAWIVLAGIQGARQEVADSRASFAKAAELAPDHIGPQAGLFFSNNFLEPYDFAASEKAAIRVTEIEPENPMGYSFRGDVRRALIDYEGARELYTTALDKDNTLGLAALKRGIVNTFLGNYDEARADYRIAADVDQGTNKITNANFSAFVSVYEGNPKAAIEELRDIDQASGSIEVPADQLRSVRQFTISNAATIALFSDLMNEATVAVENLTTLMRENAELTGDEDFIRQQEAAIKIWEGRLAARKGEFEAAIALAEENRDLLGGDANPRKLEAYHGLLGLVALGQGNAEDAIGHYERGNIQNPFIKYHLALAQELAGNTEKANELFQEVADYQFVSAGTALVRPAAIHKLQ